MTYRDLSLLTFDLNYLVVSKLILKLTVDYASSIASLYRNQTKTNLNLEIIYKEHNSEHFIPKIFSFEMKSFPTLISFETPR